MRCEDGEKKEKRKGKEERRAELNSFDSELIRCV